MMQSVSLNLESSILSLQGGHTPLIWAAMNGHAAVAALLLEKGADKDDKDEASYPRHHQICMHASGWPFGVCYLLPSQKGFTALIWAAKTGRIEIVALLLEKGADKDAKNNVSNRRHCPCERIHVGDRQ